MKKIGIFPGSFNPVHIGHLALANYIKEYAHLDEIWMMVSPHNPLKEVHSLCPAEHRLNMLRIALRNSNCIKPSDFEFSLPQPNYTITTLEELKKLYPENHFTLIIGGDNWKTFEKWFRYKDILENFEIIVYPRPHESVKKTDISTHIQIIQAPVFEISSTMLRESIRADKQLQYFYPDGVYEYIRENGLYL
ncbi:MAG: nicotinate (nicotinamide) nucleotide adenylyltransferase [Bacteroidales bacterium]